MGEVTGISWTNATWNPWHGCAKVSPGCKNCYMFREKKRYGQNPTQVVRSKTTFNAPLRWAAAGKTPRFCFTCSWSDFFIEQADPWRAEAWDVIRATPQITYQILTKRPERISMGLPDDWLNGYPNVWLGTSCENQEAADERIPLLLHIPAAVRFVSAEPLLSRLDIERFLAPRVVRPNEELTDRMVEEGWSHPGGQGDFKPIDWVIVGGESGPGARPMHPDWARSLREQCHLAGVSFFFKQWGEWTPGENVDRKAGVVPGATWVDGRWLFDREDLASDEGHIDDEPDLYRIGTKASGAMLDGEEWHEFPKCVEAIA